MHGAWGPLSINMRCHVSFTIEFASERPRTYSIRRRWCHEIYTHHSEHANLFKPKCHSMCSVILFCCRIFCLPSGIPPEHPSLQGYQLPLSSESLILKAPTRRSATLTGLVWLIQPASENMASMAALNSWFGCAIATRLLSTALWGMLLCP